MKGSREEDEVTREVEGNLCGDNERDRGDTYSCTVHARTLHLYDVYGPVYQGSRRNATKSEGGPARMRKRVGPIN
jgi:hypothetical protein